MPHRMPDERGHGDLQGRVPVALLRAAFAATPRVRDGLDLLVGAAGCARSRSGELGRASSARRCGTQVSGGNLEPAANADVRSCNVQGLVPAPEAEADRWPTRLALVRYVQQPFPPANGHRGRRRTRDGGLRGDRTAALALLAAPSTTLACSRRP